MKTKHTQGEWVFNSKSKEFVNENNESIPMPNHFGCFPRDESEVFGDNKEWNEAQYNAKLIAAAPEMLEALTNIRDWAITRGIDTDKKIFIELENAIKKATL